MARASIEAARRKILVGTSGPREEKEIVDWLTRAGYESVLCSDAAEIVSTGSREGPSLIVLNVPHEVLRRHGVTVGLEEDGRTRRIPVLMILDKNEEGADASEHPGCNVDFMIQPLEGLQFLARVKAMLRVAEDDNEQEGPSDRDRLTKLYNRRYLDERLVKEIERARRYARNVSCVMVDIDGFHDINASHGYKVGDEILKSLADILLSETRLPDIVARFGSEEFVVILPETPGGEAAILAERLRTSFAERTHVKGEDAPSPTVSCGVASYPDHANDASTLLRMADSAVYQAKQKGRNQTVVAFAEPDGEDWERGRAIAKILLVEDNDYNRTVASLVLRASGYEVLEASDGATAVDLARSEHPDLVIIDVHLHGMSGLEATKLLVENDETKDIPVVALTTRDMPGDLEALAKAGCRGYITKPIDTNNLAIQIETYLQG